MPSGIQVFSSSGVTVFDSNTASGGVIVRTIVNNNTSSTHTFPDYPGRSLYINVVSSSIPSAGNNMTVDYALGYPRLTMLNGYGTHVINAIIV